MASEALFDPGLINKNDESNGIAKLCHESI
jgi:hypothetical protein